MPEGTAAATNPAQTIAAALMLHLRTIGVTDHGLAEAVGAVPLTRFLPPAQASRIDLERWIPIPCGQALEPVGILLSMLAFANLDGRGRVLEVGTGTGYTTALLAKLAEKVTSLERYATLCEAARDRLRELSIANVRIEQRDGHDGEPGALFDRIIVHGAFEKPPRQYLDQLAGGGVLVCALGEGADQVLVRLTKIGARYDRQDLFPVRYATLERGLPLAL